ncbi:hypothetical protein UlMin_016785 [Ulmus minor]
MKFPSNVNSCFEISILDRVVAEKFHESFPSSSLENCIVNGQIVGNFDDEEIIECVNNLDALPIFEGPKSSKFRELGVLNVNTTSSIKEPPKLELKELPSHLRVLREHRKAIGWTIDDIKGISPSICMHKILMEETYKPLVQPQRRLNPSMQEVVKKEVVKLMDAGIIYPISDSSWVNGYSGYNQIPLAPEDQEKTTFTCPYVFMDDFSVFGSSFDNCLANLALVLQRCVDTNLVLNWEKCHFMVREGIVLGHRISVKGIEVDQAKIDVIKKLPPPTNVKGVRSFLGHAGFYRRFIKDFSKITKPLCELLVKDAVFDFSKDCLRAFETLKEKLISSPIIVAPIGNYRLP